MILDCSVLGSRSIRSYCCRSDLPLFTPSDRRGSCRSRGVTRELAVVFFALRSSASQHERGASVAIQDGATGGVNLRNLRARGARLRDLRRLLETGTIPSRLRAEDEMRSSRRSLTPASCPKADADIADLADLAGDSVIIPTERSHIGTHEFRRSFKHEGSSRMPDNPCAIRPRRSGALVKILPRRRDGWHSVQSRLMVTLPASPSLAQVRMQWNQLLDAHASDRRLPR